MLCFRIKWDLEFECENDEKFLGGVATQISFCTFLEIPVGVTVKVAQRKNSNQKFQSNRNRVGIEIRTVELCSKVQSGRETELTSYAAARAGTKYSATISNSVAAGIWQLLLPANGAMVQVEPEIILPQS